MITPVKLLSARLLTVVSQIKGRTLADIGTDHAYVPITACLSGTIDTAIACDVKPGPLAKAAAHIHACGLESRIQTRLGDGLSPVAPGEADCIVIAGMGGMRIIDILTRDRETARSAKQLILQPQHDIPHTRKMLHAMNFEITGEYMAREDDRFYTIITVQPVSAADGWSETEYLLGKHLLRQKDPVLYEYLEREIKKMSGYISTAETSSNRLLELKTRLALYCDVLDG